MIKKLIVIILVCLLIAFGHSNLMAIDIGVYANSNFGKDNFSGTLKPYSGLKTVDEKFNVNSVGGGVITEFISIVDHTIDFRYRFKVGAEAMFAQKDNIKNMYRVNFSNIFYFGIFNYDILNIMLGPQIGACYHYGNRNIIYPHYLIYNGYQPYPTMARGRITFNAGGINIGLSLNLDINVDRNFIIFLQINGDQNFYFSTRKVTGSALVINPPPPPALVPPIIGLGASSKKILYDSGTEGSISIGAMFKIRISPYE
jgi:hypothetical protein